MNTSTASLSPLPNGERAFRRDLARAKLVRKSRGKKGEGDWDALTPSPRSRCERVLSPRGERDYAFQRSKELRCDLSPLGGALGLSHGR